MSKPKLSKREHGQIERIVDYYLNGECQELVRRCELQVKALFSTSDDLAQYVHSTKSRIKGRERLRDKLIRKAIECKESGQQFDITKNNLFERVTDLVGYRILHLHTKQIEAINSIVLSLLQSERWVVIEGPIARTWDDEFRDYFQEIGIETLDNKRMYTSVHYIFKANEQARCACELQIRTLAEELWGEVDHKINYPHKSESLSCREQIKVLARVTSSCSRLVDSIFHSYEESRRIRRRS
jgi:ppGpp synthetase/RelA/SpoT-type nucleotidyltranferase